MSDDTPVEHLLNIGTVSGSWLRSIGVCTLDDIKKKGIIQVYKELKVTQPRCCLMMLYALLGAVENVNCMELPEEVKRDLKNKVKGA